MPTKASPLRVAHRYLRADIADPSYGAVLDTLRELAKDNHATEYPDQVRLLGRLKPGDRVEIAWQGSSSSPIKKQVYIISMGWRDYKEHITEEGMNPGSKVKVMLDAKRQSRSGGGSIMDYGGRYGVVWQPSMLTQVRRVLGLRKL
jgi:hypothetical protein